MVRVDFAEIFSAGIGLSFALQGRKVSHGHTEAEGRGASGTMDSGQSQPRPSRKQLGGGEWISATAKELRITKNSRRTPKRLVCKPRQPTERPIRPIRLPKDNLARAELSLSSNHPSRFRPHREGTLPRTRCGFYSPDEAIAIEKFLFTDGNYPGVVYEGTEAHFDGLEREGGSPSRLATDTPVENGNAQMEVRYRRGGPIKMEQWPIRPAPNIGLRSPLIRMMT